MAPQKFNPKLVLFDADNTLWEAGPEEYVSKVTSSFVCLSPGMVLRKKDDKKFALKKEARKVLKFLNNKNVLCGLVSDNHYRDVKIVCELFKIWRFFNPLCVEIHLFDGYCPKHEMIKKILARLSSKNLKIKENEVLWVDDKNYRKEALSIGVKFLYLKPGVSLLEVIKVV